MNSLNRLVFALATIAAVAGLATDRASAQDKVAVGVFPLSSSLPYFVALEKGFFKEQNIEPEMTKLMSGPANVAALITGQIEVAAVMVTLDGMNANVKKPGVAMYIALNSQTPVYKMEQFVVRTGVKADKISDLKGMKLMSAPGPANMNAAKGVLAKNGLKEGDYTLDQLDMSQHVNVMTAGTFDGGYTLEPNASMMIKAGVARTLEAGVLSKYILGDEKADAYAAGCAITSDFIQKRPDVAKRFAMAWSKALDYINKNPDDARKYLAKNTFTPDNVVDMVSMLGYVMAKDMTPKQLGDLQKLVDFGTSIGSIPEKVDATKFLYKY
ncbi:ABC transporter substrate-binding protein [Rhodopseudomonas sp. P2A-2r]|uniref:ABC transporter substrate-binding protein n=1 Tax=unclassified Rhodopseudomonas TaxID=2638247 RepID=UPI002233F67A|nr:ABC transporter substrate-binding protein [Rhodopseudomonas sp. P2A-2r]UZE47784.1 ABC transporter substrate-binding protein [Rhodopseudomonas sp. P2A-2r]